MKGMKLKHGAMAFSAMAAVGALGVYMTNAGMSTTATASVFVIGSAAVVTLIVGLLKLIIGRQNGQPKGTSGGPTYEHIFIAKDGSTHTAIFGWTSYGKGHVPLGGHKPKTTIEVED